MKALRWLLNFVCPAIPAGMLLPYGFSRGAHDPRGYATDTLRLVLPLLPWFGQRYMLGPDTMRRGWWICSAFVALVNIPGGFDLRFRVGHYPRGNGEVKHFFPSNGTPKFWKWEREFLSEPIGAWDFGYLGLRNR